MALAQSPAFLARFKCLGPECEDMCCQGWSMQLDDATFAKYDGKPDLLEAVMEEEGAGRVMRRDAATGACVKLEEGWCGIQKRYGDGMLGDACHFYPRVTRRLGDKVTMTAALSCPEVARLSLLSDEPLEFSQPLNIERLPSVLRDYLREGITSEQALGLHGFLIRAVQDAALTPEQALRRLGSVARSLDALSPTHWPEAAKVFWPLADGRIPTAIPVAEDPFNLLHALCGLIVASRKTPSSRLRDLIASAEAALACSLDWQAVTIATTEQSAPRYQALVAQWSQRAPMYAAWLRRWIAMQLSISLFPFGGQGANLAERATLIGLRYALLRLVLMCRPEGEPAEQFILAVQPLSRFMDHLGDPAFTLAICAETGWNREDRMGGLLAL